MPSRVHTQAFVVAGAIIERGGKIILVREAGDDKPEHKVYNADKGKWNQPAGWVELGENPEDTVKKEVKEETGYDFTPTGIVGIYSLVRYDLQKSTGEILHPIKIIFTGEINEKPGPLAEDISETRWFTREEIEAMDAAALRNISIKEEVADYFAGKRFPLSLICHTVQK